VGIFSSGTFSQTLDLEKNLFRPTNIAGLSYTERVQHDGREAARRAGLSAAASLVVTGRSTLLPGDEADTERRRFKDESQLKLAWIARRQRLSCCCCCWWWWWWWWWRRGQVESLKDERHESEEMLHRQCLSKASSTSHSKRQHTETRVNSQPSLLSALAPTTVWVDINTKQNVSKHHRNLTNLGQNFEASRLR